MVLVEFYSNRPKHGMVLLPQLLSISSGFRPLFGWLNYTHRISRLHRRDAAGFPGFALLMNACIRMWYGAVVPETRALHICSTS
jgi:hypothetical protein